MNMQRNFFSCTFTIKQFPYATNEKKLGLQIFKNINSKTLSSYVFDG